MQVLMTDIEVIMTDNNEGHTGNYDRHTCNYERHIGNYDRHIYGWLWRKRVNYDRQTVNMTDIQIDKRNYG